MRLIHLTAQNLRKIRFSNQKMSEKQHQSSNPPIPIKDALIYCFAALERQLGIRNQDPIPQNSISAMPGSIPLFITLYTNGNQKKLRGCIGTFAPKYKSFPELLNRYVHSAAFKDSRFKPFHISELNENVSISVNCLHTFEQASKWDDWTIGVHGTTLKFQDWKGKWNSATFLPAVAVEHQMDKPEVIKRLTEKAGGEEKYKGQEFLDNCVVERYQSLQDRMTYGEYQNYLNS